MHCSGESSVMKCPQRFILRSQATIHQPQQKITSLFDQALLLAKGKACFYGDWKDATEFFQRLGFQCPQYTNPSDYFMDVMTEEANMRKLHDATRGSKSLKIEIEGMAFEQEPEAVSVENIGVVQLDVNDEWITSFWFQTKLLVIRGYRYNFRNEIFFWSELIQYCFFVSASKDYPPYNDLNENFRDYSLVRYTLTCQMT